MTKILQLFLIASILGNSIKAQSYTPLLDDFNEWHFTTCFASCPTDIYYTDGDTVVNGIDHKILDGYHYISRTFLLTEDTIAKTVSLTKTGSKIDTYLLYDFSLNVGDSIDIQNPISPFPATPGYFRVDSIQMRMLNDGNDYKHFYLSVINPVPGANNAVWIEGIGSLSLINAPGGLNDINGAGHLSCFFKDGYGLYSNLDSIVSCDPTHIPTFIDNHKTLDVSLYPNPSSDFINITSQEKIIRIQLFDLRGQLITSFENKSQIYHIDIQELNQGLYFINVTFTTGESVIRRIVKN